MSRGYSEIGPQGKYDVKAKPTKYAGVLFRSRLEATWAAFFDLTDMEWEYEPVRMSGWVPDFRLYGRFLVEVKPIQMTGFGLSAENYEWVAKALRGAPVLILGNGPRECLGALAIASGGTVGALTVFYDPSQPFKMRSVQGDGGDDPCRSNTRDLWGAADARVRGSNRRSLRR